MRLSVVGAWLSVVGCRLSVCGCASLHSDRQASCSAGLNACQPTSRTEHRQPRTGNRQPTTDNQPPTTNNRQPTTALLALSLLLAGCSFFSRSKSNFYSLERIVPAAPVATVTGLPVGIDGVELPPGFDRREVVVRKADHQLDIRSTEQWSASLQSAVLHTLAYDLAGRLPVGLVILPGQAKPISMRSIDVVVEDFAAGPDPRVVLDARWTLRTAGQPDLSRHEQIAVDIPNLESANIAAGMSQALAQLADKMAAQLAGL